MTRLLSLALLSFTTAVFAQAPAPPPLNSHQLNPDNTITFRYRGPGAKSVAVSLDLYAKPLPMAQDDSGVWFTTTPPLAPEYYGYTFIVDGVSQLDPLNGDVRFNYVNPADQVMVPAHPASPWELTAIPHGRVDHIRFTTHIAKNLPDNQSAYEVYTPPGYDQHRKGGYPVLYLLHGWSDNETGWTEIAHAPFILDALIHEGKAVPMIVVMPLGYGDLDFVTHGFSVWQDPAKIADNVRLYSDELLTEVVPAVERDYNVAKGRENHAIAGLSMGGLESLSIGLKNPDTFAYVVGMSSAIHNTPFDTLLPADLAKAPKPTLLWVACGTDDHLLAPNRAFIAFAKAKGFNPVAVETPGLHIWEVWRDNLIHVAPLLFQPR